MEGALYFVIQLFGDLLISLNNITWVLGYSLLQWLVAGSFMVLLWQFAIYILSRSSGSMRNSAKSAIRNSRKSNNHVTERWTK